MDWETYYEKFYDWSTSTQINRMSSLTSFGASSEIAEVAQEYMDEKAASRLIKKAVAAGVQFTADEVYELSDICDTATMNMLVASSKCAFTQEQLEDLDGIVDEAILHEAARRNNVVLFDDGDDDDIVDDIEDEWIDPPAPKIGLFTKIAMGIGIMSFSKGHSSHHSGKCTGDCANCPPHYGYRYGRWYYGHHHTYGCEFGGNKGDGGL